MWVQVPSTPPIKIMENLKKYFFAEKGCLWMTMSQLNGGYELHDLTFSPLQLQWPFIAEDMLHIVLIDTVKLGWPIGKALNR